MFLADRASTSHKKKSFKRGLILHRFLFSQCHSKVWADLHIVVFEGLFARHFFSTKTGKTFNAFWLPSYNTPGPENKLLKRAFKVQVFENDTTIISV